MKNLNNDQRIRKGHKDVQELGTTASTILAFEFQTLLTQRIQEVKKIIEFNEGVNEEIKNEKRAVKDDRLHPLEAKEYIEKAQNKFKSCSEFVHFGLATNQSTLKVLETFLQILKQ